jgi:hypothetical protein
METLLPFLGGLGAVVVGGLALIIVIGAFVLMHNSKRLGETT